MISESFWWQDIAPVNQAAREAGLDATTLSCFRIVGGEGVDGSRFYYAMELSEDHPPTGVGWVETAELTSAEQRGLAEEWLQQYGLRPCWLGKWKECCRITCDCYGQISIFISPH